MAAQAEFRAPNGSESVIVNLGSMGKGQAWINGESIGRYWPLYTSPQDECSEPCDYRGPYNPSKCTTQCGEGTQIWYSLPMPPFPSALAAEKIWWILCFLLIVLFLFFWQVSCAKIMAQWRVEHLDLIRGAGRRSVSDQIQNCSLVIEERTLLDFSTNLMTMV